METISITILNPKTNEYYQTQDEKVIEQLLAIAPDFFSEEEIENYRKEN